MLYKTISFHEKEGDVTVWNNDDSRSRSCSLINVFSVLGLEPNSCCFCDIPAWNIPVLDVTWCQNGLRIHW